MATWSDLSPRVQTNFTWAFGGISDTVSPDTVAHEFNWMGLNLGPPICFQFPRDHQQPVYGCLTASNSSHTLKYLGGFTMSYDEDTETSIAKPGAKKEHWTLLEVQ